MRIWLLFFICFGLAQCANKDYPDLIIVGNIYTVDDKEKVEAFAIHNDLIAQTGDSVHILKLAGPTTKIIRPQGHVYPGFIEGHGHFDGLGKSRIELNLLGTKSWEKIQQMVKAQTSKPKGQWIIGRGWHQDKWDSIPYRQFDGYPYHDELSSLTPDHPMILIHASGHSLFANQKAMEEVGILPETLDPAGGRNVKDLNGKLVGVFEETAMRPFNEAYNAYQENLSAEEERARTKMIISEAQEECLENGITSFQDAGSDAQLIQTYYDLALEDQLDVRLWIMLRDSHQAMKDALPSLPIKERLDYFYCGAIKSEIDGALGSYGAWLLKPYFDKPGFEGQNTTSLEELVKIADMCREKKLQLCVHAIGDRANRVVLDMMAAKTKGMLDHRWRIEHAQHLDTSDITRFADLNIVASMQSVHCTSDAPFVEKRLGQERAQQGAYVWKSLMDAGAIISNGTDAPVEDIDPIANFYSAVTRKYGNEKRSFFKEQCMTRKEALKSMTINAAFAGFEEDIKGSISKGKYADFIVLNRDILKCTEEDILKTKVLQTYVGGTKKYDWTED